MSKVSRFFLFVLVAVLLVPFPAQAQGIGGSVGGVVKDEAGAPVAAAVVKLINTQTAQTRSVSTDDSGRYQIREVPPGNYDITVERPGFNTAKAEKIRVSVAQVARLDDITLSVATIGEERVVPVAVNSFLTDISSPTLSTSFNEKQIQELPILTRDVNNLALLAPGVFSVRTFSFASTLVPFAANGSRGRDNNFIIDSVDNNEPLFGGAATQFTNTDLFAEYRILTNQYKAEYGRNSGSVVNIITERGGNQWRGSMFAFGQHDRFNAANRVERVAQLDGSTRFYETQIGSTLGGPLKKENAWIFTSYQWDRARNDLSPLFPVVSTLPTTAGLAALQPFASSPTVASLLAVPTVTNLPGANAPCGQPSSGLPTTNPCTIGSVQLGATLIPFGTFLVPRSGVFDVRDHQFSGRYDQRLGERDDVYFRYLFDDLRTPRTTGGLPGEVGFSDFGLFPEARVIFRQRTQSLGMFWTHAWPTALHELRGSFTRISSQTGAFDVPEAARENQPAQTVIDNFAFGIAPGGTPVATSSFLGVFPASGEIFTIGRDTKPTRVNSNIFQLQDNFSWSVGSHSLKIGGNLVRTQTNVRQNPSDLGQYFYVPGFNFQTNTIVSGFENFVTNQPLFAWQRFPNFLGRGGDVLPVREFGQFYFFQDDIRVSSRFTVSLGIRYENYGQALNKVAELNPGAGPRVERDDNNFGPRIGFAWSPDGKLVLRGGYGIYYNPTVFNIALITWQGGRVSPFVFGFPSNTFPSQPFNSSDANALLFCGNTINTITTFADCTNADTVSRNLVNPWIQNYSLTLQRQLSRDLLIELSYVGSRGRALFQRRDRNPNQGWTTVVTQDCAFPPCKNDRIDPTRGGIFEVTNGANSSYHALQASMTHRFSQRIPLAVTAAYTWSHMLDNASEIFGPGLRAIADVANINQIQGSAQAIEVITPFPQDPNNPVTGERGNSSFDRRHRVAVSWVYLFPTPDSGAAKVFFGNWQVTGLFTAQSGQPFNPLNGFASCVDANGDGLLTNDRPLAGSRSAPGNSVAVLVNCSDPSLGYRVPGTMGPIFSQAQALSSFRYVQAPFNTVGDVGRNILRGPNTINIDMGVFKNFPWGERRNLQFRVEAYNLFNRANPGNLIGNVFTSDAQPVPAIAFLPGVSPSRVTGVIPENVIDTFDAITGEQLFLSRRFMNTGARRLQFGLKFIF